MPVIVATIHMIYVNAFPLSAMNSAVCNGWQRQLDYPYVMAYVQLPGSPLLDLLYVYGTDGDGWKPLEFVNTRHDSAEKKASEGFDYRRSLTTTSDNDIPDLHGALHAAS